MYDIDYIVVPIDFSRSSRAALAMARAIGDSGCPIEAVHVVASWPSFMERVLFPYAPLGEDAPEIEHELLEHARQALLEYHDIDEEQAASVVFGPVKPTLIDHVARTPAQLVVAGAFGEGGPMADALGSVAERLVLSAGRPVLLVRALDLKPQLRKVLVTLDLTEGSLRVLEVGLRLALSCRAELEILHVVPDPLRDDQAQVLATVLNFDRKKAGSRAKDLVEALFDRLLRELEPSFSDAGDVHELCRRRRIVIGEPTTAILDHAQQSGADVIVVGSQSPDRPSGHLGHVAVSVARRAPTHVCVVPLSKRTQLADDD